MTDPQTRIQQRLTQQETWGFLGTQGYILGIDLGGYGLRAALIDLQSHTYTSTYAEMHGSTPDEILDELLSMIQALLQTHGAAPRHLVRIGVGFGGPVDLHHGRVRLSPRMKGWENFSLKDRFEHAFDTVTLVENDANLIALGEAMFGIGQGCRHLFYMHISGGVGGGIVIDGRLYHGATATAGEIGHAVVSVPQHPTDRPLRLEEQISVAGLLQRARTLGMEIPDISQLFASEHPMAHQVVAEAVHLIALRLAQVVALLDPEIVVLGGTVVRTGGEPFVQDIATTMRSYISPQFASSVQVVSSVLGAESIAIGALALALKSLQD